MSLETGLALAALVVALALAGLRWKRLARHGDHQRAEADPHTPLG